MTVNGMLQILLYFALVLLITKPLGTYMARVFSGERTWLDPVLRPVERLFYRLFGVDEKQDMKWTTYAFAVLVFSFIAFLATYAIMRLQGLLPLNPRGFGGSQAGPDTAFNIAVSFMTNTNWQNYSPEVTLSYFSNMVALATQNWVSAAAGIAVLVAMIRGFARHSAAGIGNFWVDLTRCTLYVLLPMCLVGALLLVWQGVPQNFAPYTQATTLEGAKQSIAQGPAASQVIIKQLGTNGGGFFNANSAHPLENPTPISNLIEMLSILLIPAALTYTFGKMVGKTRQGWAIFAAMSVLFFAPLFVCHFAEQAGNPQVAQMGVMTQATAGQSGGNMEGKETRFGITNSVIWATATTDASNGSVNSMHDSYTPLGGLVPLFNMTTGEVIFGGVGVGLMGMLMFAILTVFIAGLLVGRTPEYLGKKIEQYEVKMAMLVVLVMAASLLGFSALAANLNLPKDETQAMAAWNRFPGSAYGSSDTVYGATYNNVNNSGPHGLSEILYAFASATGNNGSAFAGLTVNTPFYNLTQGLAMLIGRFFFIIPLLAIAGSLVRKKVVPESSGTFPTDSGTFVALLVGVVVIVGVLTYFPALALGPIIEHFNLHSGKLW